MTAALIDEYVLKASAPLTTPEREFLKVLDGGVPLETREFKIPDQLWDGRPGWFRFRFREAQNDRELEWSASFERQLFQRHVRMDSKRDEAYRAGTLLLFNVEFTDVRYGRAFADAVLHEVLSERFSTVPTIVDALRRLNMRKVSPTDDHVGCKAYQEDAVAGLRNSLQLELRYQPVEASSIINAAVWYLLAKRHWAVMSLAG